MGEKICKSYLNIYRERERISSIYKELSKLNKKTTQF